MSLSLFVFLLLPLEVSSVGVCHRNICLNGGTCIVRDDESFGCRCPNAFGGLICEVSCGCIHGDCDAETHQCTCQPGWVGALCDMEAPRPAIPCVKELDCPSDLRCVEKENEGMFCLPDPCHSNPCKNRGRCSLEKGKQTCDCLPGFKGDLCEDDLNECIFSPCKNGGVCTNKLGGFTCACANGFLGDLCEVDGCEEKCGGACINTELNGFQCVCSNGTVTSVDCKPRTTSICGDCMNGGQCAPVTADRSVCLCSPDYTGIACERPSSCLVNGAPCLNEGKCIRGVGKEFCECVGPFDGDNCERAATTPLTTVTTEKPSACAHVGCANGGYCIISNGSPICVCPPGYAGSWCESPASPCQDVECHNGGSCVEKGAEAFDCVCVRGFGGRFCDEIIGSFQAFPSSSTNEVSSSTTQSSTTESTTTTITSTTTEPVPPPAEESLPRTSSPPFTTPSTTPAPETKSELTCEMCQHSSRCIETFEGAVCVCEDGFKGATCEEATEACSTRTCPHGQSCIRQSSLSSLQLSCGCKIGQRGDDCAVPSSVSFSKDSLFVHQNPNVMIGTSSGPLAYEVSFSLRTTVSDVHVISGEDLFGTKLFVLFLQEGNLHINISASSFLLLPYPVNDGLWYTVQLNKTEKDLIVSVREESGRLLFTRSLPRPSSFDVFSTRLGKVSPSSFFIGCIAELFIDNEYRDLATLPRGVALAQGCPRHSPCSPSPCEEGECVDLWESFECRCPPPLLPPNCKDSLPPSTFGHNHTTSYAHLSISPSVAEQLKYHTTISLLLRTAKRDSVVLLLGERVEGTSDSTDLATFLSLEIRNGTLHARGRLGRKAVVDIDSDTRVDDNEEHRILVSRDNNVISLEVDGIPRGNAEVEARFTHPLFTDSLLIGTANGSAHGAYTTDDHLKGTLQDIRVNDLSVLLHPSTIEVKPLGELLHSTNILEGVVSDPVCSLSPCAHGECLELFNDFMCSCPSGWIGKDCSERDFCLDSPCPPSSTCYSHSTSFQCVSPAHFVETSFAEFSIDEPLHVESVTFQLRTHSDRGQILSLADYSISLSDGRLLVGPPSSPFVLQPTLNDGKWRNISIDKNVAHIGNRTYGIPKPSSLSLTSLCSLRVGSSPSTSSFWGCISNIKIEDFIPLSFFPPTNSSHSLWTSTKRHKIHPSGCIAVPQCGPYDQCLNGAECVDGWNKRICRCPAGFEGEKCEREVNECTRKHCLHGRCIDRKGEAECVCQAGYSGSSCDVPLDPCQDPTTCLNDGVCRRNNNSSSSWNCLCLPGFHGRTCSLKGNAECNEETCMNGGRCVGGKEGYSCQCLDGFTGESCEVSPSPCDSLPSPCGIHATCNVDSSPSQYHCQCIPGYTGKDCDIFPSSCTESSCANEGQCSPVINGTMCQCSPPWTGRSCSVRAGACSLVPCVNDGECKEDENGVATCTCKQFYLGERCELAGSCLSTPCIHGKCIQMTPFEHSCQCDQGYRGDKCEVEIDMCESSPCVNGATCLSSKGRFECSCAHGFDGPRCDHDVDECQSSPCKNGGKCIDRVGDYECSCPLNFTGRGCDLDVDECSLPGRCVHGECTNTVGSYTCSCSTGYLGHRCSLRDPCVPDALNRTTHMCVHGECVRGVARQEGTREWTEHDCVCQSGYSGPTCATKREENRLSLSYVLGPLVVVLLVLSLLGCALLFFVLRGKGALHGHYSPSQQEDQGRYPMGTMLKLPPEERLI